MTREPRERVARTREAPARRAWVAEEDTRAPEREGVEPRLGHRFERIAVTAAGGAHPDRWERQADRAAHAAAAAVEPEAARASEGRLPPRLRAGMERAFGADFGAVRVNADARGDRVTRALGARALTVGNDLAFRAGHYAPERPDGVHLIAHELAHVVQQRAGAAPPVQRMSVEDARKLLTERPNDLQYFDKWIKRGRHKKRLAGLESLEQLLKALAGTQKRKRKRNEKEKKEGTTKRTKSGRSQLPDKEEKEEKEENEEEEEEEEGAEGYVKEWNEKKEEEEEEEEEGEGKAAVPSVLDNTAPAPVRGAGHFRTGDLSVEVGPHPEELNDKVITRGAAATMRFKTTTTNTSIAFLQTVIRKHAGSPVPVHPNRTTDEGRFHDRVQGKAEPHYGLKDDGGDTTFNARKGDRDKDAFLYDLPATDWVPGVSVDWTATTFVHDIDSGDFLGSVEWGYDIAAADAKLTLKPLVFAEGQPAATHVKAFRAWNAQADLEEEKRNAPNQKKIKGV